MLRYPFWIRPQVLRPAARHGCTSPGTGWLSLQPPWEFWLHWAENTDAVRRGQSCSPTCLWLGTL